MRAIDNLEIHVAHGCNLTCESCSHYSNQGHKGLLSLDEAEQWIGQWNHRLRPAVFSLLGGEPTLHPRLPEFVALARKLWPQSQLRLVTNGFFLHRHPELPSLLADPSCFLCLSIHHDSPEYQQKLEPIRALVDGWIRQHGIRVEVYESSKDWTRRYQGFGSQMEPFDDGQPRRSWEICKAKLGAQLFEGRIWKCGPLAYLKLQDAKYQLSDRWKPYLAYQPLAPDCSDEQLEAFFAKEDEAVCGMCSATPRFFQLPMPLASKTPARAGRPAIEDGLPQVSAIAAADVPDAPLLPETARGKRSNGSSLRLVAIASVKNELDIIEAFVRHHAALAQQLVVLDNGSTDGTLDVLRSLEKEGLPLEVVEDPSLGKYQSRRMTHLMRAHAAERHRADWVLTLDADEFLVLEVLDSQWLTGAATDTPVGLPWRTYVPDRQDDPSQLNPVLRLRQRLVREPCRWEKLVVPRRLALLPDAVLSQGNHHLEVGGRIYASAPSHEACLAHFPIRSPEQYLAKIAVGSLQYQSSCDRDMNLGWHYREPYELLKRDPQGFAEAALDAARRYAVRPGIAADLQTMIDPLPYRGGPLAHTPPDDDRHRGWKAVLLYAEQLARRHAELSALVAADGQVSLERQTNVITALHEQLSRQHELLQQGERELTRVTQVAGGWEQQLLTSAPRLQQQEEQIRRQQAQLEELAQRLAASDAQRRAEMAAALGALRGSWTWRAGRLLTRPLAFLKRSASGRA